MSDCNHSHSTQRRTLLAITARMLGRIWSRKKSTEDSEKSTVVIVNENKRVDRKTVGSMIVEFLTSFPEDTFVYARAFNIAAQSAAYVGNFLLKGIFSSDLLKGKHDALIEASSTPFGVAYWAIVVGAFVGGYSSIGSSVAHSFINRRHQDESSETELQKETKKQFEEDLKKACLAKGIDSAGIKSRLSFVQENALIADGLAHISEYSEPIIMIEFLIEVCLKQYKDYDLPGAVTPAVVALALFAASIGAYAQVRSAYNAMRDSNRESGEKAHVKEYLERRDARAEEGRAGVEPDGDDTGAGASSVEEDPSSQSPKDLLLPRKKKDYGTIPPAPPALPGAGVEEKEPRSIDFHL